MTSNHPYIYIAYALEDQELVIDLFINLMMTGFATWQERPDVTPDIPEWRGFAEDGIRNARVVILILSIHSMSSPKFLTELQFAAEHGKFVVVLIAEKQDATEAITRDGIVKLQQTLKVDVGNATNVRFSASVLDTVSYIDRAFPETRSSSSMADFLIHYIRESEEPTNFGEDDSDEVVVTYFDYALEKEPPKERPLEYNQLSPQPNSGKTVGFSLYSPSKASKQTRYSLIVYAHKPEQQNVIKQDVRKFGDELGDLPKERHTAEPIPLAPKTEITIVPEAEGITFDPPEMTKTWDEKWLRFNFDFEVPETYSDEEVLLRVSVQVKGFEVACIKSSCEVVAASAAETVSVLPDDPLVDPPRDSGTRKADAHLYRNVFLSYSHKDEEIAWRRARQIEQALGDRVFMDVKDLRAGDDWETRLFEKIDQADIIHLLWSENSAHSDYCRKEWTYALEKKCGDTRCFGVIRPVYWQKPMPEPPPELKHLHFQPIKLEEE